MNPFDKILKSNSQSTSSTKKVGLYDDILSDIKTSKPKTSTLDTIKSTGKEIVKGLAKLPLRGATNIDQMLAKTADVLGAKNINPNREIYSDGLKYGSGESAINLGRITPIGTQTYDKGGIDIRNPKEGLKNTAKDLLDIGGSAVEAASYLPFGRALKSGARAFKAGTKTPLAAMAVEGAVGGATQSLGQQTQQYAQDGTPVSFKEVGKAGIGGAIAGPALGLVGRGISKIFGRGEVPANLAVADEVIPQVPTRKPKLSLEEYSRSQGYEPYKNPNELPTIQLGSKEARPELPTIDAGPNLPLTKAEKQANYMARNGYEPYKNPNELPTIQLGSKEARPELPTIDAGPNLPLTKAEKQANYMARNGYEPYIPEDKLPTIALGSKGKDTLPTVQVGSKKQPKVANYEELRYEPIPDQSVRSQMPDTISSIIKQGKKAPELVEQAVKEASAAPKLINPVNVEKATKIVEEMPDSKIMTPFERQKNVEQVASIMERPQQEIIDIVKGNVDVPDNIPRDAYFAVAKNIANDTNNTQLALDLLPYKKEISSKTGQSLQATKIAKKDNIVDILADIEDERFKKLSKDAQLRYSKELEDAIQTVQKEFESIKNLPGTRQQIVEALSKLIC